MLIIPVLDIKGGLVVRGMMGDRANYRPIESRLAPTARPVDVARGLATLLPFPAFYVADLDAIERRAPNTAAVAALCAAFPSAEFWLDAGIRTIREAREMLQNEQISVVLGSETVESADLVAAFAGDARAILSLDYRGDAFVGPAALERDASLWPSRVIAMTLAKVGSGAGPDMARLSAVRAMAGPRAVYAAGGVRDAADVQSLRDAGIAGALVASALHDGRLAREELERLDGGHSGAARD